MEIFNKQNDKQKQTKASNINKRKTKIELLLSDIKKKLSNENFVSRAPEDIVKREQDKMIDLKDELEKIDSNLNMLT